MVVVPTILLSTSCSILSNTNEIALQCKTTVKLTTSSTYPYDIEIATNKEYNETYLINLKDKNVLLYVDPSIAFGDNTEEQRNVSITPKTIYFQNADIDISNEIDRKTLKIKVFGDNTMFGNNTNFSGGGICEKIPYPPKVSSKSKI